jgi:hypothetical protein
MSVFSITGEFMTRQCRDFWHEGLYSKSLKILDCLIGASHEVKMDILFGRKKLVGVNDLELADDDWQPDKDADYPSFYEGVARGDDWLENKNLRYGKAWDLAYDAWPDRKEVWRKIRQLVSEETAIEIFNQVQNRRCVAAQVGTRSYGIADVYENTRNQLIEAGITDVPSVQAMIHRGSNLKLEVDHEMRSTNGWLLPNGKYYGCSAFEHIGLAENLLREYHSECEIQNAERQGENLGWIKIRTGGFLSSERKPTKKQLNKIWDYAEKHKRDYETMIARIQ